MVLNKCKICNSNNIYFLFNNKDRMFNLNENFTLFECKSCGIISIFPSLNKSQLKKAYPKEYYSFNKDKNEGLKLKLSEIFYNKGNFIKKTILAPIKFLVRTIKIKENANLLDIGCGDGKFLEILKDKKMNLYGLEPYINKKLFNQGIKIYNKELEQINFKKDYFDIISMNHVIEHSKNPLKLLISVKKILKNNGKLIIATPNTNSIAYKIFKKYWYQLDTPRHLFLFSEKNLKKMCEKLGFKYIKSKYNSTPMQFLISLNYMINNFRVKKIGFKEDKILNNKLVFVILIPLINFINFLKQGDQFEIILTK